MAKNQLTLDTSQMEGLLQKLAALDETVAREAIETILQDAAKQVQADTAAAVAAPNLPARGKYSDGQTAGSVHAPAAVMWEGMSAWVPVGFDFAKPGAGGFLISGTPKMQPVHRLHEMYRGKRYINGIYKQMYDALLEHIQSVWEAGA